MAFSRNILLILLWYLANISSCRNHRPCVCFIEWVWEATARSIPKTNQPLPKFLLSEYDENGNNDTYHSNYRRGNACNITT
jgi:hypothetical protein